MLAAIPQDARRYYIKVIRNSRIDYNIHQLQSKRKSASWWTTFAEWLQFSLDASPIVAEPPIYTSYWPAAMITQVDKYGEVRRICNEPWRTMQKAFVIVHRIFVVLRHICPLGTFITFNLRARHCTKIWSFLVIDVTCRKKKIGMVLPLGCTYRSLLSTNGPNNVIF